MKKILIIGLANRGGGSQTFLWNLIKQFQNDADNRREIYLILPSSWKSFMHENTTTHVQYVDDFILSSAAKRFSFENVNLIKIIKAIKPELIYIPSEIIPLRITGIRIPIIINYHATMQLNKRYIRLRKIRDLYNYFSRIRSIRRADQIVFVSHHSEAELLFKYPYIPREKSQVIYHGVERVNERLDTPFSFPYILSVGDRHEHKKYDQLIHCYAQLVKQYGIHEHLVILGRKKSATADRLIEKAIIDSDLKEQIHILDSIENSRINGYYQGATIYVSFSEIESFGMTPLEALANNTPAIIAEKSALPEIYGRYPGFINSFQTEEEIIRILHKAMTDNQFREEIMLFSGSLLEYYTWKRCADKYNQLFEEVQIVD